MKKILCLILVLSLMLSLSACSLDKLVTDAIKGILEGAISGGSSGENNYTEPPVLQDVTDVIDLSGAKRVELVYMDAYVITGVTEDAARAYEQTLTAGGYAASGTGWVNDTTEPNFMSYLDGQYPKMPSSASIRTPLSWHRLRICATPVTCGWWPAHRRN